MNVPMDENFIEWLRERGESTSYSSDVMAQFRLQYEIELQDDEHNEGETVSQFVGADRRELDNFAYYMLGKNRRVFHQRCDVPRELSQAIFDECWRVFHLWQDWQQSKA
jgi:hypothetical protein